MSAMSHPGLFDLSGKVALITGGSRGLGRQMALAFADAGADVIIASRKIEACNEVADEIRGKGRRSAAIAVHAGRWDDVNSLIEQAYAAFGQIDILVANAGMSPAVPPQDVTEALFDSVMNLNFKGPFRLCAEIGHRMKMGRGGTIIVTSSSGALVPAPNTIPYGGAKAALNAMTVSLAHGYGPNVRVNAISAGPFLTDIAKAWPEEMRETSANALGRPGRPEEIVGTALWLASDASSFVTGAIIRCDGGMH